MNSRSSLIDEGFTLIEVLVSLVVISIAFAIAFNISSSNQKMFEYIQRARSHSSAFGSGFYAIHTLTILADYLTKKKDASLPDDFWDVLSRELEVPSSVEIGVKSVTMKEGYEVITLVATYNVFGLSVKDDSGRYRSSYEGNVRMERKVVRRH